MNTSKENIAKALSLIKEPFIYHFVTATWGESILIMEKTGGAFARVYWFYNDKKYKNAIFLDWLSVNEDMRRNGIGKELQVLRENIGILFGAKTSYLWVKKDSWMHDWYQRRGYKDWIDYEEESENAIWMKKSLKIKK